MITRTCDACGKTITEADTIHVVVDISEVKEEEEEMQHSVLDFCGKCWDKACDFLKNSEGNAQCS